MDTASYFNQIVQLLGDGDINSAVALIQSPDVDVNYRDVTHDLQTLMMRICYMTLSITDLERVFAAIFEKSPDVNTQDSWGRTALMHACIANKPGYIEGLLEHDNTDVTVADFDGNNALSYAVQNCDIYTMEDILNHQHGATLATKINAKGQSPLAIAQKSGDKSIISLIESYANKTACLQDKKKQRKPRNKNTVRLPLAYSPSPERGGHVTNRSIGGKPQMSLSLPNSPDRTMENYLSPRTRPLKVDLKLNICGRELYSKCDSAPIMRSDVSVENEEGHPLALTSARLDRRHYKRDCLRHQPSSLQSDDVLPDLDYGKDRDSIPDNLLRKQRRPSISLPDLRIEGFLVQSGGSTPTSDEDSIYSDSDRLKNSSPEQEQDDNVFAQDNQNTRVTRRIKTTKQSDRQFTLPEIGNNSSRVSSKYSTANHISPLARSRKYSNSDDQLQRTC